MQGKCGKGQSMNPEKVWRTVIGSGVIFAVGVFYIYIFTN